MSIFIGEYESFIKDEDFNITNPLRYYVKKVITITGCKFNHYGYPLEIILWNKYSKLYMHECTFKEIEGHIDNFMIIKYRYLSNLKRNKFKKKR